MPTSCPPHQPVDYESAEKLEKRFFQALKTCKYTIFRPKKCNEFTGFGRL